MKTAYTQTENDILALISHLIVTKPNTVSRLLKKFGVTFSKSPSTADLIEEVVNMIDDFNRQFIYELDGLLALHLKRKGHQIIGIKNIGVLERTVQVSQEDNFLGILGGAIKGIGMVSKLFKKKRRPRSNPTTIPTNDYATNNLKREMAMQAAATRRAELIREQRREEERAAERRRELERERQREDAKAEAKAAAALKAAREERSAKQNRQLMIGGGVLLMVGIGTAIFMTRRPAVALAAA